MKMIKIKPKNSIIVRDPLTREPLHKSGQEKTRSMYWLRRIADKSVIEMNKKEEQA